MINILFYLYGSGKGLGMPLWDGTILWLVDTQGGERKTKNGRFYFSSLRNYCIKSFELFRPEAQTVRILDNVKFKLVYTSRKGFFIECCWECLEPEKIVMESLKALLLRSDK